MSDMTEASHTTCPTCGTAFQCGYRAGEKTCWCFQLPHIEFDETADTCLCPKCLHERIQQTQVESKTSDENSITPPQ